MSIAYWLLFGFGLLTIATVLTGWLAWRVTTAREQARQDRINKRLRSYAGQDRPVVSVRKIR